MAEQDSAPATEEETALAEAIRFQRDLYLYWREVDVSGGLSLTGRGYVSRPGLRRVREALACGEPGPTSEAATERAEGHDARLFYLRRLLERLGLLRVSADGSRLAAEPAEMARFLAYPLAERLRICARLWVAGGWWPDRLDPNATLPRLLAPAPPRIALARRRTLESLASAGVGAWVAVPPSSNARAERRGRMRVAPAHPLARPMSQDADGETLRAALVGALAWMGFVALDPVAEPATCRVGLAVRALLVEGDLDDLAELPGRVVVQPDATLVAFPPLTAPLLLGLDTCADAIALDTVARYRLSRAALARAREAGWGAADVAARLEALSGQPLPSNVRATLADWERHVARLRLTPNVTVLEARTPELLDALLADRTARGWVERRLTPTVALLAAQDAPRVRDWLLRRGELPAWRMAPGPAERGAGESDAGPR